MTTFNTIQFIDDFNNGKVFAYPTEAVYGLGCDPLNQAAMQEILRLKLRPVEKGVILIAGDIEQIHGFVDFDSLSDQARTEIHKSWPGPFTWLVPKGPKTPDWICGGSELVAVRVTTHPLVKQMCAAVNSPLVSTSANPGGEEPARSDQQVNKYFGGQVVLIAGELGEQQQPSTIINAMTMQRIR